MPFSVLCCHRPALIFKPCTRQDWAAAAAACWPLHTPSRWRLAPLAKKLATSCTTLLSSCSVITALAARPCSLPQTRLSSCRRLAPAAFLSTGSLTVSIVLRCTYFLCESTERMFQWRLAPISFGALQPAMNHLASQLSAEQRGQTGGSPHSPLPKMPAFGIPVWIFPVLGVP